MESLTQEDYRKVLQQENAEKKFVMARIKRIKAEDEEIAERDNIYNMTLPEFLEWFKESIDYFNHDDNSGAITITSIYK